MTKTRARLAGLAVLSSVLAATASSTATKEIGTSSQAFTLSSPRFEHQSDMPALYTCDGKNVSPPLSWSGEPAKARSLALVVEDPDATEPPRRSSVHWIVFDIPVVSRGLREGVQMPSDLPRGAKVGLNEWKRAEYSGPCPPAGRKHHYLFKLYALDTLIDLDEPSKPELEEEMKGHIVARAELIGTYQRPQ